MRQEGEEMRGADSQALNARLKWLEADGGDEGQEAWELLSCLEPHSPSSL